MAWQELEERWAEAVERYLRGRTNRLEFTEAEARELINLRKKKGYAYRSTEGLWSGMKKRSFTTPIEGCSLTASGTRGT